MKDLEGKSGQRVALSPDLAAITSFLAVLGVWNRFPRCFYVDIVPPTYFLIQFDSKIDPHEVGEEDSTWENHYRSPETHPVICIGIP